MKKILSLVLLLCVVSAFAAPPKYVFLFIGDGMSFPQRLVTEEYMKTVLGKQPIFNHFPVNAATRTSCADKFVTDSAASGTAIACGEKTNYMSIGVGVDGVTPLESVAYVAKKRGMKVGIMTSVTINHATPSAFYAHRKSRGMLYEIGLDMLDSGFDYFAGGGMPKHNDEKSPLYKGDIFELAPKAGYFTKCIQTMEELAEVKPGIGKVWLYGSLESNLTRELDAVTAGVRLQDYLKKGIELLDNPNGFFIMCEGGAIDWGGHDNDAGYVVHEGIALNECVQIAYDFAQKHPEDTLIVVTGDHETGGLNAGFANTGIKVHVERLQQQKVTGVQLTALLNQKKNENANLTFEDVKPILTQNFGLKFSGADDDPMVLSAVEAAALKNAFDAQFVNPKGKRGDKAFALLVLGTFNKRVGLTYTTGSHSAMPVVTSAWGNGAEIFADIKPQANVEKNPRTLTDKLTMTGAYENSDVALKIKSLLR